MNGEKKVVNSKGLEISGVKSGTYTISVTPIGKEGNLKDIRGETKSISQEVKLPEEEVDEPDEPEIPDDPDEGDSDNNQQEDEDKNPSDDEEVNNEPDDNEEQDDTDPDNS